MQVPNKNRKQKLKSQCILPAGLPLPQNVLSHHCLQLSIQMQKTQGKIRGDAKTERYYKGERGLQQRIEGGEGRAEDLIKRAGQANSGLLR